MERNALLFLQYKYWYFLVADSSLKLLRMIHDEFYIVCALFVFVFFFSRLAQHLWELSLSSSALLRQLPSSPVPCPMWQDSQVNLLPMHRARLVLFKCTFSHFNRCMLLKRKCLTMTRLYIQVVEMATHDLPTQFY